MIFQTINKSPTEMATANEVLHLVQAKANALHLAKADLVLDHAVYCKPLEIISNPVNSSLKNAINLIMGVFHAECIFMSVISKKRFLDTGLKDLVVEARSLEEGSTISAYPHHITIKLCVFTSMCMKRLCDAKYNLLKNGW